MQNPKTSSRAQSLKITCSETEHMYLKDLMFPKGKWISERIRNVADAVCITLKVVVKPGQLVRGLGDSFLTGGKGNSRSHRKIFLT